MDNYLSLLGRGLTKRKKFISLGRLDMPRRPRHPTLREAPLFMSRSETTVFFPFIGEALKGELSNYLIV